MLDEIDGVVSKIHLLYYYVAFCVLKFMCKIMICIIIFINSFIYVRSRRLFDFLLFYFCSLVKYS